jgi:hypothetical protein
MRPSPTVEALADRDGKSSPVAPTEKVATYPPSPKAPRRTEHWKLIQGTKSYGTLRHCTMLCESDPGKGGGDFFHETELSKVSFQSCFAACWPKTYQHHNHEQKDYGRDAIAATIERGRLRSYHQKHSVNAAMSQTRTRGISTTNKCASFSIKGSTATLRTLSSLINPSTLYTCRRSNG